MAEVGNGDQVIARPYDLEAVMGQVGITCKVAGLPTSEIFVGVRFVRRASTYHGPLPSCMLLNLIRSKEDKGSKARIFAL